MTQKERLFCIKFREEAAKEWHKLGDSIKSQFAKKLEKLKQAPHIPSAKLRGMNNCYKIKLRASGYRLVYTVIDSEIIIVVVAVGKRNRNEVYDSAKERVK